VEGLKELEVGEVKNGDGLKKLKVKRLEMLENASICAPELS
jgi:hypothetical protein